MVILTCICQTILKTKQNVFYFLTFHLCMFFSLLTQTTLALTKTKLPILEKEFLLEISQPQTVSSEA